MKLNKNGLARNLARLSMELNASWVVLRPAWRRWFKKPWSGHEYMNLFVEYRKEYPYLTGHVDGVLYPVLFGMIIWSIVR